MYTLPPQSVRLTVILSLYLLVCSASPSYYIVVPLSTIHDANTSLAIHWFGDSDLNVTAEIRAQILLLTNVTKVIKKDSIEIITFPETAKNTSFKMYELHVNGYSQNTSVFSEIYNFPMQMRNTTIFIQTDKDMYKPTDTVKIRIITVNYNLKPNTNNVDLTIRDPMYNNVLQRLNMTLDLGVISTQFQLTSSSMLGDWSIEAKINDDNMNTAFFSVAEKVFQKFDVKLDAPSFFIDSEMEKFTATVMAKYPYGTSVRGNLTISLKPLIYEVVTDINKINKTYEISGSVNFSFTQEEILKMAYWGGFNITATVYEEFTGIAVESSVFVRREISAYRLAIKSQNPEFEQGKNFTAQIQVLRLDNKTLTKEERGKNVTVKISQGTGAFASREFSRSEIFSDSAESDNIVWKNFTISDSGIVNVEFPVLQSLQWIHLEVTYQSAIQMFYFEKQTTVAPFIQINISETSIKVGTPFHLQVKTYPDVQELYYVVLAKGMVVAAGKNKTTFSLTPEQSWVPAAQLVIYFRNLNGSFGDIIQTSQMLMIKGALRNQVTLSWNKNSAKPSENVTLSIGVKESRSLVGLCIVEKKSSPIQDVNALTPTKVDTELFMGFQSFPDSRTDGIIYQTFGVPEFRPNENAIENQIPPAPSKPEFKETWIWLETNISSSLSRNLQVTVPDKNTTWQATAFVMSEGLGLGVTDAPIELAVVKPLIITLNMPNTLTRGEKFILEVMLSSSWKEDLSVLITLAPSNSFEIIGSNNNTNFVAGQRNVTIPRENGTVVFFPIQPKILGNITINVTATSTAASDTLTGNIIVRAEGMKNYYSESALFDVRGSANTPSTVSKSFSFTFPSDLVQDSAEAFISVAGDLLGTSINGLESLIVMPYGCGEQNMIAFAPNIYVLLYLIATNQVKSDIKEHAITFMEQGYERELLYRHNDGSFSAFGNYDPSGSTWLTAFVLRCFLQARTFIYISLDVLNQAVEFIVSHQDMDTGIFSEPGRVIHRELQGGLDGPITLTAYMLTSLVEDADYKNRYQVNVQKAVQYLESKYDAGISSNYTLAVVAYALTLANSSKATSALNLLNSRATVTNRGTKYWSAPSLSANTYWQPRTTDIETAAYALLCFQRQNRIADGISVMKWLTEQRNQFGGYASTQDTVMALLALSQFVAALPSSETSLVITVTGPGSFVTKTFQVNSNLLQLQIQQVEISQPLSVTATAVGYGLTIVQLNLVYNTKALSRRRRNTVQEAFKLDLKVNEDSSNIYQLILDVSISYQGEGNETGMVIVEVHFLNGFKVSTESIPTTETLAKVEPEPTKVNLYLNSLNKNTVTISVPMVRSASVAGSQDAVVTVTDYYNPRNTVTRSYNSATMKKIAVCDYCGFNCTQCKSNVQKKAETSGVYTTTPTFFILYISMVILIYLF